VASRPINRVLIIGARGVLGTLTVRAFAAAGWEVRCGARRPRAGCGAKSPGPGCGAPRPWAGEIHVDLDSPDSILAAMRPGELIINTVPHQGLLAEHLVLERGGMLINTSALPAAASRSLRAVAAGARGTVLMNAGLAPGVTNIVAADLLHRHPDAQKLEIAFTLSSATPRGPASADFLQRGLTAVAKHRVVGVPLPGPFGVRRCVGFGEGDAGWLGGVAEGRVVRLYICIAEPEAHQRLLDLNGAAGMTKLPGSLIGPRKPALDGAPSREPVAHWIAANRGERRLDAVTVECQGDFLHAARSTVVFADALLRQERRGGCFDPEEIFTLGGVESELREAGIRIVPHGDRTARVRRGESHPRSDGTVVRGLKLGDRPR
jgi:hypothetical protein